jgi:murein DD-endopeptidase MepM/ murein hydrolase activator NlpD
VEHFPLPADAQYSYASAFNRGVHNGIDIFAPKGTPVLAVSSGIATTSIEPKGGKVVYLQGDDRRKYFYGHLDTWNVRLLARDPWDVEAGEVLGYVGNTGNAAGKSPHVHFEVEYQRRKYDPFPLLREVDPVVYPSGPTRRGGGSSVVPGSVLALALLWWWTSSS